MLRKVLPLVGLLALAACHHLQPMYAPNDSVPPTAQRLPLDRVEADIVAAGSSLNWHFQHVAPGHLTATQTEPKYSAVIDIYFDQSSFRIQYQSSSGMPVEGNTIHEHYNQWIRNLERAISSRLANEAVAKP